MRLGESRNRKKQKNTTTGKPCKADRRGSKSLSETARIEMRQSGLLKNNQSQQSIMLYKITNFLTTIESLTGNDRNELFVEKEVERDKYVKVISKARS